MAGPNGCTLWPDGWRGVSWRHCCDAHDLAYLDGADRLTADLELAICVYRTSESWPLALTMGAGVVLFGWLFYKGRRRRRSNPPNP
jgi:hypothetical protein